jgi:tRNA threonylcarbamoyladenosine biosynthesis protein TsaB
MKNNPLLLAIDTATRFAGLALYDGETILAESYWLSRHNHSSELMPALVRMLDQQKLTVDSLSAVAVAIGPGSFTGLRIGLSTAKGIAKARNIPILGIPTLDIFTILGSQRAMRPHDSTSQATDQPVLPGIDRLLNFRPSEQRRAILAVIQAGRGRFCAARYEYRQDRWIQRGGLHLTTLDGLVELAIRRILVCGELDKNEIAYLAEHAEADVAFASPSQTTRRPACLAELAWQKFTSGEQDDLATLSPIYLTSSPA